MENKFRTEQLPAVLERILLSQSLRRDRLEMANYWYHQLRAHFNVLLDGYGLDPSGSIQIPSVTLEMKLHHDFKDVLVPVSFQLIKVGSSISITCQIPGKKPFVVFSISPEQELLFDESGEPINNIGGQFCRNLLALLQEELHTQATQAQASNEARYDK